MPVSELDLAEFPHYMLRKSHYMLRKSHYMLRKSHYMLQKSHHILRNVDWFSIVDCPAVNLTLKSRTMLFAFIYIMPLLLKNLVETALISKKQLLHTYTCPYCLLALQYRLCLVLRAYLGHRPLIDTDKKPFLSFSIGKDGHFGIKFVIFGHRQPNLAHFEK